jgi:excisionase family DNA binding protein
MKTLVAFSEELQVDAGVRDDAKAVVTEAHDRGTESFTVTLEDGQSVQLSPRLSAFLMNIIESAATEGSLSTSSLPKELTTTVAAQVLGVSRPTLMKMISRGDLAVKKVGSHTRLAREDVLAFNLHRRQEQAEAVQRLLVAGEAFE